MTPALKLLSLVWASGKKDSWERINHSMRNALSLAIGSGLRFESGDFSKMANLFRWGYWVTECTEWIYADAIVCGNDSCIAAFEKWAGRKPFRANDVGSGYCACSGGYIHASSITRQRERLGVRMSFVVAGQTWWVTSFDDEAGIIRIANYEHRHQCGKPKQRKTLTHKEFAAFCPAPKKAKPAKPEEDHGETPA